MRILIGGRADIDLSKTVEVSVRAPANQNALKGLTCSRLKLKYHRHEVGGLQFDATTIKVRPEFDTSSRLV